MLLPAYPRPPVLASILASCAEHHESGALPASHCCVLHLGKLSDEVFTNYFVLISTTS